MYLLKILSAKSLKASKHVLKSLKLWEITCLIINRRASFFLMKMILRKICKITYLNQITFSFFCRFWCLGEVVMLSMPKVPMELHQFDYNLLEFFDMLGVENAVKLLVIVLLEHQVLVYSSEFDKLMLGASHLSSKIISRPGARC